MNAAKPGDLGERQLLNIVKRKQQAVSRGQSGEGFGNGLEKAREKPPAIRIDG